MNKNIDDAVAATVDTFVSKAFMFSAFDVTKTVRNSLGKSVFVSHGDVRVMVADMYAHGLMSQYVKDLAKMGSNTEAWVYYHPCSDISTYDSDWMNSNPNQDGMKVDKDSSNSLPPLTLDATVAINTVTTTSPTLITTTPNTASSDDLHTLTKEGRLNIPKSILKQANFDDCSRMFCIKKNNDHIVISKPVAAGLSGNFDYVKYSDKTGRIRLNFSEINSITPNPYSHKYKISCSANKDEVIIEKTF